MKILLVDDSNTMRRIQRNTLGTLGFTDVDEAEDGADAVAKVQAGSYELVLMDWNMPNMTGLEALKAIRANPKTAAVPVIMVTSESEKSRILEAVQAGATNYIVKPFTPDVLKEKLSALGH
jgi:two-component system chemotaxis response regulator CheY